MIERVRSFDCFGGTVSVRAVCAPARATTVDRLLDACRTRLLEVHATLTRFEPASELSRLNAEPGTAVPASPLLRRLVAVVPWAGRLSGGLVDATCLPAVDGTGIYTPAWQHVRVDRTGLVHRPTGVRIDSGGLAKGMAADLLAPALAGQAAWAVDCAGDVRVGGARRTIEVRDPWGGEPVHRTPITRGAAATSGITARGRHVIDPRTGEPADTGMAQVTAFAPTALEAEVRAKAALLAGPDHLPHGGVMVHADGAVRLVEPTR